MHLRENRELNQLNGCVTGDIKVNDKVIFRRCYELPGQLWEYSQVIVEKYSFWVKFEIKQFSCSMGNMQVKHFFIVQIDNCR